MHFLFNYKHARAISPKMGTLQQQSGGILKSRTSFIKEHTQNYKHRHRTWEHVKAKALVNYTTSLNLKTNRFNLAENQFNLEYLCACMIM
jgi:hypothetical protein